MKLKKIRNQILQEAKPYIVKFGWNENLFVNMKKDSKFTYEEMNVLFPRGYTTLIEMYLREINSKMTVESQKINLIRLRIHERIREIFILRLKIMSKEKKLISKTFLYFLLPQNYKLALKNLYKTVDQMWFLAGDNSTNFNFYSKRAILVSIYTRVMMHFVNNNKIDETIILLNKQLKRVSNIPRIKNRINDLMKIMPRISKLGTYINFVRR